MSSWVQKLEKRLTTLGEASSKESMQTLAKWVGFNRKHTVAFCEAFIKGMEDETRCWLYFQVIHEIMLLDKGSDKWDKLQDIRTAMGESVVLTTIASLDNVILNDQLKPLVDQWDDANVFGAPMLIQRIQQCLKNPKRKTVESTAHVVPEVQPAACEEKEANDTIPEPDPEEVEMSEDASNQTETKNVDMILNVSSKPMLEIREEPSRSLGEQEDVDFDFEAEGVPEGKVDAREFLEPCKALVTFQIARDLRADAAAQLTSILSVIPEDVKKAYREMNNTDDITQDQVQTLSVQLTDNVLDIDLDEAFQNVQTFRELVQKQHAARQRLVNLLLKSRCQFGSIEAAEEFYGLGDIQEKLQRRKDLLADAMDLEGIQVEEGDKTTDMDAVKKLPPLTWYEQARDHDERSAKRTKVHG